MNDLQSQLAQNGFMSKLKEPDLLQVYLGGLTMPVAVHFDRTSRQYRLKSHEGLIATTSVLLIFYGLYDSAFSSAMFSALSIAFAALGLLSILLTEVRAQTLRALIASLNQSQLVA